MSKQKTITKKPVKNEDITIKGQFIVWPSGKKTHIKFVHMAFRRKKSLPKGFFKAVEETNSASLKRMVIRAKELGIKDDVVE